MQRARWCLATLWLIVAACGQIVAPIADAQGTPDGAAVDPDAAAPSPDAALGSPDAATPPIDAPPALVDAAPGDLTLTVILDGAGVGDVKSVPSGIACAPICAEAFPANTSVTLTAAPHVGAYFAGWSEPSCGMAPSCTVAITASLAVVAKFEVMP